MRAIRDDTLRFGPRKLPASQHEGRGLAMAGIVATWSDGDEDSRECAAVLRDSLRKIRRWRVPPRWSDRDWLDEITAEMALTVLHAANQFDPSRGIPRRAFLYKRAVFGAYARYRCEWKYAIREASKAELYSFETFGREGDSVSENEFASLQDALGRLRRDDLGLIEGLFWGGRTEPEFAKVLGVSQQAVNKRKRTIFKALRSWIRQSADFSE